MKHEVLQTKNFASVIEALEYWNKHEPKRLFCRVSEFGGKEESVTFGELYEESKKTAAWLRHQGLSKGERVVLALPNSKGFLTGFLGTLMAGGVAVPVAARNRLLGGVDRIAELLAHVFRDSAAKYAITTENQERVIGTALRKSAPDGVVSIIERLPKEIQLNQDPLAVFPEDVAFIQYTSGSTSLPKGVVIRHHQLVSQIESIIYGLKSNAKDVAVSWLPLFHDMGLIGVFLHSLYVGMKLILISPEKFIFDPKQWLLEISKHKATLSTGPNSAYSLCSSRIKSEDILDLDLSSWRIAFSGAEPISEKTMTTFMDRFGPYGFNPQSLVAGYGMAENCLAITFRKPGEGLKVDYVNRDLFEKEGKAVSVDNRGGALSFVSCGKPVLNNEVMVVGSEGLILSERQIGEVIVRGPSVMDGYFKKESETKKTIRNHWLYTGDLGYLAEGELYITGRKKELIIKGGRNYCPNDIEGAAEQVEGVRKGGVLALGIYDEALATDKVVLLVEMKPGVPKKELTKNILKQVSAHVGILPDEVHLFPRGTLERTTSGKVQREKYKQLFLAGKLKTKVSVWDRIRYFKFRFSLLVSMCFYYVSMWIKRYKTS